MWIEELKKELTGRLLAIWTGKNEDGTPIDMPEWKRFDYIRLWKQQAEQAHARGLLRPERPPGLPGQPEKRCSCGKGNNG
jgi:hypothetical protein